MCHRESSAGIGALAFVWSHFSRKKWSTASRVDRGNRVGPAHLGRRDLGQLDERAAGTPAAAVVGGRDGANRQSTFRQRLH